ncbi:MAG: pyrroline-5-carboxylate reductase [Solirubrobacteraceae bacterium]|jgi:pyrroline-5-carboxylate reductase|nr:pyrroline-5-carboxylate reductase [Solirubrobacteraceae bacterium]
MQVGLIGAGNMARALARGLGEPVLCADPVPGKAQELADEVGGEALEANRDVAERADVVFLCHKPAQLEAVAGQIAGTAKTVISILGGRSLADVEAAYPGTPVARIMPNTAVEVGHGVITYARGTQLDDALDGQFHELLRRVGTVIDLDDALIDTATGINGVAPAYLALFVEAWVDAAVKHGIPPVVAGELAVKSAAGAIELLAKHDGDTLGVRRAVTSPGGVTAAGLAALERRDLRAALLDAQDAVVEKFGQ